jgi:hypothetical protein
MGRVPAHPVNGSNEPRKVPPVPVSPESKSIRWCAGASRTLTYVLVSVLRRKPGAYSDDRVQCRRGRPFTDPEGAGKPRLAMAVAFEVVEGLEDRVWCRGLASLTEPDLVPHILCRYCPQHAHIYMDGSKSMSTPPDSLSETLRILAALKTKK